MNILNRLTIKHLLLNKKRTLVTIIGVILSAALMTGIGTIFSVGREYLIDDITSSQGPQHITVNDIASDRLKYVKENVGVQSYFLTLPLGYSEIGSDNSYKPYLYLVAANPAYMETQVLMEGRFPENDTELVIPSHLWSNGLVDLKVGDTITVDIGYRMMEDMPLWQNTSFQREEESLSSLMSKTYTVVGVMERPYDEAYSAPGYTALTYLDEEHLPESSRYQVSVIFKNVHHVQQQAEALGDALGVSKETYVDDTGEEVTLYDISYHDSLLTFYGESSYTGLNQTLFLVILVVLSLVMIGCSLVIYNSFAISVMERKKQFGLFASIGATAKQIRQSVFFEAFLIGLIGIPIGVLSGIFGIWVVIMVINHWLPGVLDAPLQLVLYPWFIILPVVYMIVTIFVSAYLPARRASRTSPIMVIRQQDDIKMPKKKKYRSRLISHLFGVEGDLAYKNIKRNQKKYRITILSLVVSIVLFIGFSTFVLYMRQSTVDIAALDDYDIEIDDMVSLNQMEEDTTFDFLYEVDGITNQIQLSYLTSIPLYDLKFLSSQDYHPSYTSFLKRNGIYASSDSEGPLSFSVLALDTRSYEAYLQKLGFSLSDYEGSALRFIFLNQTVGTNDQMQTYRGEMFNVTSSDSFPFTFTTRTSPYQYDEETGEDLTTYIQEVKSFPLTVVTTPPDLMPVDSYLLISESMIPSFYQAFPSTSYQEAGALTKITYLETDDSKHQEVIDVLEKRLPSRASIHDYAGMVEENRNIVIFVGILLYGFITLVTLIGVTSVFHTISTSMALRRREFAVLRSVGLSPKGFTKMICFESLFYGLKALLWGIPLAFGVVFLFYFVFSDLMYQNILIPWNAILITIVFVFLITFLTMRYATRKYRRENILDAIRSENI